MRTVVIGSRGSRLALWQAEWLAGRLRSAGLEARVEIIHTSGDRLPDHALTSMGGKGVFVKEIEEALLAGSVDVAAHSLKDLPTSQPDGLTIACIPEREDARDVLVAPGAPGPAGLRPGAIVGTGSPRRSCQLKALRADLVTRDLRGNLDTRLAKLRAGEYDAILLARAGLRRLGIEVEGSVLDHEQMIPAPGQGAMAIEIRSDDRGLQNVLRRHHDESSAAAVTAERALLRALGGGCRAPIAAFGRVTEGTLDLLALVAAPSGGSIVKDRRTGDARDPESVGLGLADALLARGAAALLGESAAPPAEEP